MLLPCSGDAFEEMGLAEEVDPWFSLIPTPITKKKYKIKLKKNSERRNNEVKSNREIPTEGGGGRENRGMATRERRRFGGGGCIAGPWCGCTMGQGQDPANAKHSSSRQTGTNGDYR